MALTAKMKAFAQAKLQGKSNKEAAVLAGYSERSATMQGSQLAKNPEVIAYLDSLNNQGGGGILHMPLGEAAISAELKDMDNVTNSLEFLQYIYKNPRIDRKTRIDAAKAALPYEHGKVAEPGVKQGREAAAGEAAKKGKFATADEQRKQQRVS
ncbi:terminase small subunit [Acinetobacter sp. ANC 4639]